VKILVACEFSGIVRDAFLAKGHDAWSCDLEPTERDGPHIRGDVLSVLGQGWDLMIAHPPCTRLAVSGARYFTKYQAEQQESIRFFMEFATAPVSRIAIENPVCIMSTKWRKPDQIIQPWQFGHPESKATCLWLKGLAKLVPTSILAKPACGHWQNQTPSGQNKLGPSPTRASDRARTYQGIAEAMADQWG
jgi:hypothetical protein